MRTTLALTLLLGCLTANVRATDVKNTAEVVKKCVTDLGVTEQDIFDLRSGKVKPADVKENVKCTAKCVMVASGYMDAGGNLLTDKIKKQNANHPQRHAIYKALEVCGVVKGANACDTAFQIVSCVQTNGHSFQ
ncbi:general odorant-binding protein 56h-like [Drosophila subobscura]|uniref:general odorant-binding protein 56h-like n=1 Tax=Drosophila subobscura TaxID=7241 RepID=UPI00155A697B|nr:general odorant-binding protein 56h-like [Drosophila subobscura]